MDLQETFGHLGEEVKKIPWWGWLAVGGVVLFLFWGKLPFGQSDQGSSTTAPVSGDTSGGDSGGSSDGGTPTPTPTLTPTPPGTVIPVKPPLPKQPPTTPTPTKRGTYTVVSGDTLIDIAARNGENEPDLYSRNANVIEATARQHGFADSDHGHWIFPSEVLTL